MIDPRLSIIDDRLAGIKKVIPVSGGKGGIGKSVISSSLALALTKAGRKVGLLDLDFSSPSLHAILGAKGLFPEEDKGIIPPEVNGIEFMTMAFYSGDNPSPLRGGDVSNAMIELLAITRWGDLDFLIIDMPPGISDATLDAIRLIKRAKSILVTTPSKLAFETVGKVMRMFLELQVGMVGVVENMRMAPSSFVEAEVAKFKVPFLGVVNFDRDLEGCLGEPSKLLETYVVKDVTAIIEKTPELVP